MQVNHPFRPGVTKNVPDGVVEKWLENGWTEAEPPTKRSATKKAASKPSDPSVES